MHFCADCELFNGDGKPCAAGVGFYGQIYFGQDGYCPHKGKVHKRSPGAKDDTGTGQGKDNT